MKTLLLVLVASAVLAGCIVVPYDQPRPYRSGPGYSDRDRDGVPNRYDRRPGDPSRY